MKLILAEDDGTVIEQWTTADDDLLEPFEALISEVDSKTADRIRTILTVAYNRLEEELEARERALSWRFG